MAKQAREITAFRTHDGRYQYRRMPFGLCHAGSSFQRMVDAIFSGLKDNELMVFIDDTCVASRSSQDHIKALHKVFSCIRKAGLTVQPSKCTIGTTTITFLGHRISPSGIHPDESKIAAIKKLPAPTNVSEIRRFLGMASCYRRFIARFAAISEPLVMLTRKQAVFEWGEEQQAAF